MPGLSVSDVVNVQVNMTPLAVPLRNFGALCIAGSSTVIDVNERIRQYSTLDGVAVDFGSTAPEFLAADLFFSQSPQPGDPLCRALRPGRLERRAAWRHPVDAAAGDAAQSTEAGHQRHHGDHHRRHGAYSLQATSAHADRRHHSRRHRRTRWSPRCRAITAGHFAITIDGTLQQIGPINFSNMTGADTAT